MIRDQSPSEVEVPVSESGSAAGFVGKVTVEMIKHKVCCLRRCTTHDANPLLEKSPFADRTYLPWMKGSELDPRGKVCKPCWGAWQVHLDMCTMFLRRIAEV
eukprot:1436301-Alexandrium_andersonii.AAC.1